VIRSPYKKGLLAAVGVAMAALLCVADDPPPRVVHVVYVKWKDQADGGSVEAIAAALKGARDMAGKPKGPEAVFTKSNIKDAFGNAQDTIHWDDAIVMIFKDQGALKDFTDSQTQKDWYKQYVPVRRDSRSVNVTNDPPPPAPPPPKKGGGKGDMKKTKEAPKGAVNAAGGKK
jgi:hypothetical protein